MTCLKLFLLKIVTKQVTELLIYATLDPSSFGYDYSPDILGFFSAPCSSSRSPKASPVGPGSPPSKPLQEHCLRRRRHLLSSSLCLTHTHTHKKNGSRAADESHLTITLWSHFDGLRACNRGERRQKLRLTSKWRALLSNSQLPSPAGAEPASVQTAPANLHTPASTHQDTVTIVTRLTPNETNFTCKYTIKLGTPQASLWSLCRVDVWEGNSGIVFVSKWLMGDNTFRKWS